jgi:oxaloacetate decarboxylase alpha subunit
MPADQVDAMIASGPAQRHYTPEAQQVLRLVDHLAARQDLAELTVEKPGLSITARYRKESVVDA